ncbi:helix-turn-helix transcriptional regulator [Enterococcus durans]|uniref:helix-turn-helix domain-containing protein n=1 Tax=Enterococcus durans TaxID=53345 RepID=UPI0011BE496B|nr:helix-turn-helix transcriptional regulator [Enterococcus durans]QED60889.1 helix-turn-helix transcriptional regulator [Enterococcus durans]QED63471.1 helix-turn-helix transcriptional regulator [Enterococcus durans]
MTLFDRIKYLAKKQGKSINDIEREMGYSQNTLYRLKTTNPSSKKLQEIADHFQVSTDYLLGRTDNPNIGVAPEERKLTVEEALASVMSSDGKPLTDNDREILTEIIEAYIEKKYK